MASLSSPSAASRSTSSSRGDSTSSSAAQPATPVGRHEARDLVDEHRPGGLVLEHDVVAALERHQPRVGELRGERPGVLELVHPVLDRVQDQRRHRQARQVGRGVGEHPLLAGGVRRLPGHRDPLELVEPGHLLLGRARDHQRGEHPPELRRRPLPADLDDLVDRLAHRQVLGRRVGHRGRRRSRRRSSGSPGRGARRRSGSRPDRPATSPSPRTGRSRRARRPPPCRRCGPRASGRRRRGRTDRGRARRTGSPSRPGRGRAGSAATPGSASRAGGGSASRW